MQYLKKYKRNQAYIKCYSNGLYKLVLCNSIRILPLTADEIWNRRKGKNEDKLSNNILRARQKVFELAYCNEWDYFATLTIDQTKLGRYDLDLYRDRLSHWIRDFNRRNSAKVKYLLIPERCKDGAWHVHGFLYGLPQSSLRNFMSYEHLPYYILDKLQKGVEVKEWVEYRNAFGFNDLEPIRSKEAAARYVTKYIGKNLGSDRGVSEVGSHMYYCSKGLNRAVCIKKGTMPPNSFVPDYSNEHVAVKWFSDDESRAPLDLLQALETLIV